MRLAVAAVVGALVASTAVQAAGAEAAQDPATMAAMAQRFRALGYTVAVPKPRAKQPYEQAFVVQSVDSDTLNAFNVAVYRFASAARAKTHRRALVASFGQFPESNQWQIKNTDLFVGTTASTELHCTFSSKGPPNCKPYTFPHNRFETVVAVAEGG